MGKRRRVRAPVQVEHFRLLKELGRNKDARSGSDQQREMLWQMACQTAGLPKVRLQAAIDHWKQFIGGTSHHSSVAINGEIDPELTTISVCWNGKLTASHTTKTLALLGKMLSIYAHHFPNRGAFLGSVENLSVRVADKVWGKPKEKSS